MDKTISFVVFGKPATAGSKSAYTYQGKDGKIHAALSPASKKTKPWMQQVAETAKAEYDGPLLTGPIQYKMIFYFRRPKGHYGTGKNNNKLKISSPLYHTKKPDSIKLARAIEDALTGIIWKDDSQVFDSRSVKSYTEKSERVEILIKEIIDINSIMSSDLGIPFI